MGDAMTYDVDIGRLENVVERIIKGLQYHHTGIPCVRPWRVRVWFSEFIDLDDEGARELQPIVSSLFNEDLHVIGNNVFTYRYKRAEDKPDNDSVWLLKF